MVFVTALAVSAGAADWKMWGGSPDRNLHSKATNLPAFVEPGEYKDNSEDIDLSTTKNVRWVTKLGSQAYGNTTVADGRVYIGTNNESPKDPKHKGDRGIIYCLDEKTGKLNWQLVVPKLGAGKVSDWEFLGICSSPAVEGDRVYVVSNRCEILCLDVHGLKNGNDGPFKDEGAYMAGPGAAAIELGDLDADIIWVFDMREELGVFPHNIASSSVLIVEDKVFCTTSNGQDWSHLNIPSPFAPCLIALDKKTGTLLGEEMSGISENLMHCNWSSPSMGQVGDQQMVFFGAGDGICYAFNPNPVYDADEDLNVLPEIWRFDCVPEKYKVKDGKPLKYPAADGPSEIIATPVFYKNRVYVSIGQDPEHGEGVGRLVCIDATKKGDITDSGLIWEYDKIHRTISTVSIDPATGLLFVSDYSGFVYCLDAESGEEYWVYDMKAHMWSSTLVADGKVYASDEDGDFVILPASKDFDPDNDEPIFEDWFDAPIYSSPIEANGVIYVATQTHLYAIENQGAKASE